MNSEQILFEKQLNQYKIDYPVIDYNDFFKRWMNHNTYNFTEELLTLMDWFEKNIGYQDKWIYDPSMGPIEHINSYINEILN